jgi:hypothetical protein
MMLRKAASRTTESTQFLRENLMSMSESLRISVKYSGGFKEPAFIGTGGQNAPIAIRENVSEIVVTDSWWVVGVTIAATAFFGPGLMYLYLRSTPRITPPLIFAIIGVLIVGVCCFSLVTTLWKVLFHRPRMVITGQAIRCFRGSTEAKALWREQVTYVASRSWLFEMNRVTVPNYVLYARMQDGSDVPLCVTDKQKLISQLERGLADKGYKIEAQQSL